MNGFSLELFKIILKDLWRHRFIVLLYGLIVATAFMSVIITAKTKVEVSQLEQLNREKDELNNEWLNLRLEEQTLSEHSKVIEEAEHRLNMVRPSADNEKIIEE
ncbi:MAG: cell division protein FtsL [Succinivibrionaceae bacterium]